MDQKIFDNANGLHNIAIEIARKCNTVILNKNLTLTCNIFQSIAILETKYMNFAWQ